MKNPADFFKFRPTVIPDTLIQNSDWYHPYIHSVPYTFNKAQEAYYTGFNLDYAEHNLYRKARQIFRVLTAYYKKREYDFSKFLYGQVNHDKLKNDIDDFIKNFANQYNKNQADNYPYIDEIRNDLEKLRDDKDYQLDNATTIKKYETTIKNVLKKKKVATTKLKGKRITELAIITEPLQNYLHYIMKKYNIPNPDLLVEDIYEALISGKRLSTQFNELQRLGGILKEEMKYIKSFLNAIRDGLQPGLKGGGWRQGGIALALSRSLGKNEEIIVEQVIDQMIASGTDNILKNLQSVMIEQVGESKTKTQDITDTKLRAVNKRGETFEIGLDVKFNMYSDGKGREYKRGANVKEVKDVIKEAGSPKDMATFMYLIVNSYYFKNSPELSKDWYAEYIATGGRKFFNLLNTMVALYGLLPTNIKITGSIKTIYGQITKDKRIFIIVDGKAMLMTDFLNRIGFLITNSSRQGKPIAGLQKNLEEIIGSWNRSNLFGEKINYLQNYRKQNNLLDLNDWKNYDSSHLYKQLKKQFVDVLTGTDLKKWKYTISRNEFRFK